MQGSRELCASTCDVPGRRIDGILGPKVVYSLKTKEGPVAQVSLLLPLSSGRLLGSETEQQGGALSHSNPGPFKPHLA